MFERLEGPLGDKRADYLAASIAQTIANVHRGKEQKAYTLEEMKVPFGEPPEKRKQTWQEQMNILTLMARVQASTKDQ